MFLAAKKADSVVRQLVMNPEFVPPREMGHVAN